jgi:hypothetical protein
VSWRNVAGAREPVVAPSGGRVLPGHCHSDRQLQALLRSWLPIPVQQSDPPGAWAQSPVNSGWMVLGACQSAEFCYLEVIIATSP